MSHVVDVCFWRSSWPIQERREPLVHLEVAHLVWYPRKRVEMPETEHPEHPSACLHRDPTPQRLKMMAGSVAGWMDGLPNSWDLTRVENKCVSYNLFSPFNLLSHMVGRREKSESLAFLPFAPFNFRFLRINHKSHSWLRRSEFQTLKFSLCFPVRIFKYWFSLHVTLLCFYGSSEWTNSFKKQPSYLFYSRKISISGF